MFLFFIILLCASELQANEFMHAPRTRRVSLSKMKEHAADAFSEQLRLSADMVQLLGVIQVLYFAQELKPDLTLEIECLKLQGTRLEQCRLGYVDLLGQTITATHPFEQSMSLPALCGYLTRTIGCIQQRIIIYLQDIFEDKGSVFIKEHTNRLPEVVKTVRLYTQDFKALSEALHTVEKKLSGSRLAPISSCKEHESQTTVQKT